MGEHVVPEDIGCKHLTKRRWSGRATCGRCGLRSSHFTNATSLESRVGDRIDQVCADRPDCHWPIDACEAAIACITDDGVNVRKVSDESGGKVLNGVEGGQVELLRLEGYTMS